MHSARHPHTCCTRLACGISSGSLPGVVSVGAVRCWGNQWLPLQKEQTGKVACDLEQAFTLAAGHLLRHCASSGSAPGGGSPRRRSGRRAPGPHRPRRRHPMHQSPNSNRPVDTAASRLTAPRRSRPIEQVIQTYPGTAHQRRVDSALCAAGRQGSRPVACRTYPERPQCVQMPQ
jgi:hypothetical protein